MQVRRDQPGYRFEPVAAQEEGDAGGRRHQPEPKPVRQRKGLGDQEYAQRNGGVLLGQGVEQGRGQGLVGIVLVQGDVAGVGDLRYPKTDDHEGEKEKVALPPTPDNAVKALPSCGAEERTASPSGRICSGCGSNTFLMSQRRCAALPCHPAVLLTLNLSTRLVARSRSGGLDPVFTTRGKPTMG